jgi:hypothetical protein
MDYVEIDFSETGANDARRVDAAPEMPVFACGEELNISEEEEDATFRALCAILRKKLDEEEAERRRRRGFWMRLRGFRGGGGLATLELLI